MARNIQEAYRTLSRLDQKRNSYCHIIIKIPNAQNKERILEAVREKGQVTCKGRPIRITPDFTPETMKARRPWVDVIRDKHYLRVKAWKSIFQANGPKKQAGVAILILNKTNIQPKVIKKKKKR